MIETIRAAAGLPALSTVGRAGGRRRGRRRAEAAAQAELLQQPGDRFLELSASCAAGCYHDALASSEVTVVLMLLLLRGTGSAAPAFAPVLERYRASTGANAAPYLRDELFFQLQSVVLAADAHDCDALREAHAPLWPHLSPQQNELLLLLPKSLAI